MAMSRKAQSNTVVDSTVKNNAVAFVNWSIPTKDGKQLRSSKGFPVFQNPQYPNKGEDLLVELAKKHGGSVTVQMTCRVVLNNGITAEEFDLSSIEIL